MAESFKDLDSGDDMKLRDHAFRLALLEKAASTLGTLNFIWATAVLLGGFSQSLKSIDFWFVSVILVVEGLRIVCRHGELATRRLWSPNLSFTTLIYVYLFGIQEFSAFACIAFSSLRIQKQQYGSDGNLNRNRALNLFYSLSLVESSLTLRGFAGRVPFSIPFHIFLRQLFPPVVAEKMEKMTRRSILNIVGKKPFSDHVLVMLSCFFYDTYCRCMNGSVFDGLKMDFVSYSMELLQSIDYNEQLTGARLLSGLLKSDRFPSKKLRVIGTTPGVLERLIEMLNWEKPDEKGIRGAAAEIMSKLVEMPRNRIRVMAIPEFMESIASLLYDSNQIEMHLKQYEGQSSDEYKYSDFTVLGLRILKIFANDSDNCGRIGTKKGPLCKIIELNPEASESEIVRHLEITPIETLESLARQQDFLDNTHETSSIDADHSDHPNLQSVSNQV